MKCPTCESCEYEQYCGATEIMRKCEKHNKKVNMTNEEWFCGLTTEEKAEVLYKFYCDGRNDELQRYVSINEKSFVDWLKQPHKELIMTKEELQKKYSEILKQKKLKPLWGDEHDPCEHCSANPKNGGSGLCNCTLACPKIT